MAGRSGSGTTRGGRKPFDRKQILESENDHVEQERQLSITQKELTARFEKVPALAEFPEGFIYYFDARGADYLKREFDVIADATLRGTVYTLLKHIREANPFLSLPSKEAGTLRTLMEAIKSGNVQLGVVTL